MIRFIDLRGQGTGYRFAYFDTTVDRFLRIDGDEVWDEWWEVTEALGAEHGADPRYGEWVIRLGRLTPQWAKEPGYDNLDAFYGVTDDQPDAATRSADPTLRP